LVELVTDASASIKKAMGKAQAFMRIISTLLSFQ